MYLIKDQWTVRRSITSPGPFLDNLFLEITSSDNGHDSDVIIDQVSRTDVRSWQFILCN